MFKKYVWFACLIALVGCSSNKQPITGQRVSVVDFEPSVKVDEEASRTAISLPSPEDSLDWPQNGRFSDHKMRNYALSDRIRPLWSVSIGSGNSDGHMLSLPVVADGNVYSLDTEGRLMATNAKSGARLWEAYISPEDESDSIIGGGVAYADGKVFVTSPHAEVLAFDASCGKVLWRYKTQSPVRAAPTVADGRVYAVTISNHLDVLNQETGEVLWSHAGIAEYAGLLGSANPAVSRGVAIVPYSSGEVYALKADNGHQYWLETLSSTRRPDSLSSLSHIRALPVMDNNHVIVVGYNQRMANYDVRRGEKVWERNIGGIQTPAVLGNFIFMINLNNELLCITKDYGQVVWVRKLDCDPEHPQKSFWKGPLIAANKLHVVNASGHLLAMDPSTGKTINTLNLETAVSLPPFSAQGILYLISDSGNLIAYQ